MPTSQTVVSANGFGVRPTSLQTNTHLLGTCACTATGCTFVDCVPSEVQGIVVNGSYSFDAGSLQCRGLTYRADVNGTTTTVTLECDVKVTDTTMSGVISSTGSTTLGRLVESSHVDLDDLSWTSHTTLTDVVYDASGLKAGSARVDATLTVGLDTFTGGADVVFR